MSDGSVNSHRFASHFNLSRCLVSVLLLALAVPVTGQAPADDQIVTGFPVVLDNRSVTDIYAANAGVSAADRAQAIAGRIEAFA